MTDRRDGGPAFPWEDFEDLRSGAARHIHHPGMSLRDWMAGQALAGLFARGGYGTKWFDEQARMAYAIADAMLREREKGQP